MNRERLPETANPPWFQVDDPGALERDHLCNTLDARDAFVETDRSRDAALKSRVLHEVVMAERLLDHAESKAVERFEGADVVCIVERIGAIPIDRKRNTRLESVTGSPDIRDVRAGCNLDSDPSISLISCCTTPVCKQLGARLNSKCNPALYFRSRLAIWSRAAGLVIERCSEGDTGLPGKECPQAHLDCGSRHAVAANSFCERCVDQVGGVE